MALDPQVTPQVYDKNLTLLAASATPILALAANATELNALASAIPAAAITSDLTTLTVQSPAAADYNWTFLTLTDHGNAAVFSTLDEAKTCGTVIKRLQTRVAELEARLQTAHVLS